MRPAVKIAAWFAAAAILVVSLGPPGLRPGVLLPHGAEHLLVFLALALAVGLAYRSRIVPRLLALVVFAAAVEIAQLAVPGRHARMSDFLMGCLGCVAGTMLALVVTKVRNCSGGPRLLSQAKPIPLAERP